MCTQNSEYTHVLWETWQFLKPVRSVPHDLWVYSRIADLLDTPIPPGYSNSIMLSHRFFFFFSHNNRAATAESAFSG